MKWRLLLDFCLLGLAGIAVPLAAQTPQNEAAMAELFSSEPQFSLKCRLTIEDQTGDTKTRDLSITALRTAGDKKFLAQVTAPSFLKNLKFLRLETKDGTGTWLKTARGTQRLAPQADPESLFGSDFTTGDFQPGSNDWVVGVSDSLTIVLERPTEPRFGWSRQILTLRKADHLILRSDFLSQDGTLVRRYEVKAFSEAGVPSHVELADLKNRRRSTLVVVAFDSAKPISGSLFLPGSL